MKRIIGYRNSKLMKSIDFGYLTGGVSLAPHKIADGKTNLCPHADGCEKHCLFYSGNGKFKNVKQGRINNALQWINDRDGFLLQIVSDIELHIRKSSKMDLLPCIRLNVLSDIPWEKYKIPKTKKTIFEIFPNIQFYDYTAWPVERRKSPFNNYHITYSYKSNNPEKYKKYLSDGHNVAVVFKNKLPVSWNGYRVVNGDIHDLTFTQPKGTIIGLTPKGIPKDEINESIAI